ncbi:MAG: bifunctional (p)ppGpp synthetase/guanosine-3',5'-bis(diphosphate) 3'-pyrophosphohydrolase [Candidatus Taylorbacteria bacterium]|nr:bifunctional (p)ppGpp synthetase/guanosine-3',5'-bis(diphosphate) 3'-pyrophosphohydrolase [Candidatus Taylorbacteria bacterium]
MRSLQEILGATRMLTEEKKALIEKAYGFVMDLHKEQLRRYSTEPITVHATRVAFILAELGMPHETIVASLLHHATKEGSVPVEKLSDEFGEAVALLVEGATKLRNIKYQDEMGHLESLRKLFVASTKDIRILILKLADRLDSMRSLPLNKEHHLRISKETMEIYVPLARRLGLQKMSREMEDLAFRYIEPGEYKKLHNWLTKVQKESAKPLEKFHKSLLKHLVKSGLLKVETDTRLKGIYSIYQKVLQRKKELDHIYDVLAIRIQVDTVEDCYRALGSIHAFLRPLPGRIKDYIAFPKPNGYQSLHTTVFTGDGRIIEIQIRTRTMHEQAEYGLASHLLYKELGTDAPTPSFSWFNQFFPVDDAGEKDTPYSYIPKWLRHIFQGKPADEVQADHLTSLKTDFFQSRMFIFDPRGEVVDLPMHATPIDFAYEFNAERGNHLHGAKVNGKLSPLDAELRNGDIVELITKDSAHPTEKWLQHAKTTLAKHHIKQYLESTTR